MARDQFAVPIKCSSCGQAGNRPKWGPALPVRGPAWAFHRMLRLLSKGFSQRTRIERPVAGMRRSSAKVCGTVQNRAVSSRDDASRLRASLWAPNAALPLLSALSWWLKARSTPPPQLPNDGARETVFCRQELQRGTRQKA